MYPPWRACVPAISYTDWHAYPPWHTQTGTCTRHGIHRLACVPAMAYTDWHVYPPWHTQRINGYDYSTILPEQSKPASGGPAWCTLNPTFFTCKHTDRQPYCVVDIEIR